MNIGAPPPFALFPACGVVTIRGGSAHGREAHNARPCYRWSAPEAPRADHRFDCNRGSASRHGWYSDHAIASGARGAPGRSRRQARARRDAGEAFVFRTNGLAERSGTRRRGRRRSRFFDCSGGSLVCRGGAAPIGCVKRRQLASRCPRAAHPAFRADRTSRSNRRARDTGSRPRRRSELRARSRPACGWSSQAP